VPVPSPGLLGVFGQPRSGVVAHRGTVSMRAAPVSARSTNRTGGTMQQATGFEQTATDPTEWPWSLSSLRAALTDAAQEGYRLGLRKPALADAAREDPVITSGEVPDEQYEALEGLVETLTSTAAVRFAAHWDEDAAYWIEGGVEAAVVLGLQRCGADRTASPSLGAGDIEQHVHDPECLSAVVDEILEQVVTRLAVLGYPVPGSQDFLDRRQDPGDFVRLLPKRHEDGRRQVRTSWIRD